MNCRHCQSPLELTLVDLGSAPPSNAYLRREQLKLPESWYPLKVLVCQTCWLVQTDEFPSGVQLFDQDYAYFSGFSTTWLQHSEAHVSSMQQRMGLNENSLVVEVAANDGYLLQYVQARNIPCLGVEPTASTARAARAKGLEIVEEFFGRDCAERLVAGGRRADLMIANNVFAHVPDLNDFAIGFQRLLKPGGVATFEFPHLLKLMEQSQFDTIYHEHFCYLSLTSVKRVLAASGLEIFDVECLATHGGSLRVYAQHAGGPHKVEPAVRNVLLEEADFGLSRADRYKTFQASIEVVKDEFVEFLLQCKRRGKKVGAYGAAAKGNTLLNFAGVRPDLVHFVVDRNPAKQGRFMPGSRVPIVDEAYLQSARPDYVVIFPWNLRDEITSQLSYVREWDGQFVTAVPSLLVS